MKRKHIIILLIAGCTITAIALQFLQMNFVIRTVLVTILIAFLFSIRALFSIPED